MPSRAGLTHHPAGSAGSVGLRPEYFEDAALMESGRRGVGSTFRAHVDVTEWLGGSQYSPATPRRVPS